MSTPWDALASPANANLAHAGAAPPGNANMAHNGNADLAYAGTAKPPFMQPPVKPPDPPVYPPPVASFTYTPASPGPGATVTFDGHGSRPGDPAAPITGYAWNFNNGAATGSGVTATWKMPTGHGSYPVRLTVTASDTKTGTASQTVTN